MTVSPPSPAVEADWPQQLKAWLGGEGLSVQLRGHGVCLHIVFEGHPCPSWKQAIARLREVTLDHPEWMAAVQRRDGIGVGKITYLLLYGRLLGQKLPDWKRTVSLAKLTQMVEAFQRSTVPEAPRSVLPVITPDSPSQSSPVSSPAIAPVLNLPPLPSVTSLQPPTQAPAAVLETVASSVAPPSDRPPSIPESLPEPPPPEPPAPSLPQTSQKWAERIARQLQAGTLPIGVVQQVAVKILPPAPPERSPLVPPTTGQRRLLVTCLCQDAPAFPLLERVETDVVPALTTILRQLPLQGFDYGYGVIKGVMAEAEAEKTAIAKVRVNLQSSRDRLKSWARWGDVEALMRLFNQALADICPPATAVQQDKTLYVFCRSTDHHPLVQSHVVGTLAPIAQVIAPQGIHSLVIYGYGRDRGFEPPLAVGLNSQRYQLLPPPIPMGDGEGEEEETPLWVDWIDLPATTDARRAESTLALAVRGYLSPLAHLLERLVNPDLEHWLATGGRQVVCDRHRRHPDTLQVVIYGPDVPDSQTLVPEILQFLRPLGLSGIHQVVIYGQSIYHSHWESIHSLGMRSSQWVPTITPVTFAPPAPGVWIDDTDDETAPATEEPSTGRQGTGLLLPLSVPRWSLPRWQDIPKLFRQGLIWSGLCASLTPETDGGTSAGDRDDGLLDLLVGMSVERVAAAVFCGVMAAGAVDLGLKKRGWLANQWLSKEAANHDPRGDRSQINPSPPKTSTAVPAAQALPPLPSFNSPQFDHQLELYRQFVMDQGRPDVLVVGSSRALRGFDPGKLNQLRADSQQPPLKIFNLSVNGATAKVIAMVLVELLPPGHLPPLVIWADGARAFNSGRSDGTHGSIAQSPAYRLVIQDQFPLPNLGTGTRAPVKATLAEVGTLSLPQPPNPTDSRGGSGSLSSGDHPPTLVSSREVSPFVQDTALGYWLKKLPTEADFDAWIEGIVGGWSNTYGRRPQLRVIAQTHLQTLPIVDLWSQPVPAPEVVPVLDLLAAGAQRRLGNAPAITNGKQDGIVDENGFLPLSVAFDPTTYYDRHPLVPGAFDNDYRLFSLQGEQSRALKQVIQHLRQHRSQLVFVNVPLTEQYLDPVRSLWDAKFSRFMGSQELIYLDFATLWPTQVHHFSDPSHLNRTGAHALVRAIADTTTIPWPTPTP